MKFVLELPEEHAMTLVKRAGDGNMTVDEYVCSMIEQQPVILTRSISFVKVEEAIKEVVDLYRRHITGKEKGFVFTINEIMPMSRGTIDKETIDHIDNLVISSLKEEGIISLWSNDNHPWQYIRE